MLLRFEIGWKLADTVGSGRGFFGSESNRGALKLGGKSALREG